jgi:hypothetical protein
VDKNIFAPAGGNLKPAGKLLEIAENLLIILDLYLGVARGNQRKWKCAN